jgi:hypothetical protein
MNELLSHRDGRPRIHIREHPRGYSFQHGPTGMPIVVPTKGEAFETAMAAIGERPAVIIFGDDAHG